MASSFPQHSLADLVPDLSGELKVASLLRHLVAAEMRAASQRQRLRSRILPVTLEELGCQLQAGRAGVVNPQKLKRVDATSVEQIVADAFEDGLILLFVDERRFIRLDETVEVRPETRVMIVRRAMLVG